jgi:ssDNA-binding Zn-finger/Zn-ribbon topoisomerase 1
MNIQEFVRMQKALEKPIIICPNCGHLVLSRKHEWHRNIYTLSCPQSYKNEKNFQRRI